MDRHTGSPVRQTMVDTVTRELLRGRGAENEVALEARVDDLHNHLLVGEADDQAVLRGVVLVLRLGDQALAGIVCKSCIYSSAISFRNQKCDTRRTVCLALAATAVLDLETGEVRVGLDGLDEGHLECKLVTSVLH